MKKILFALLISLCLLPGVKADTIVNLQKQNFIPYSTLDPDCSHFDGLYYYSDFDTFIADPNNKTIFDTLYKELKDYYFERYFEEYPYYFISVFITSTSSTSLKIKEIKVVLRSTNIEGSRNPILGLSNSYVNGNYKGIAQDTAICDASSPFLSTSSGFSFYYPNSTFYYLPLQLFEANYNISIGKPYSDLGFLTFNIYDSNNILKSTYNSDSYYPVYFETTYDEFISSSYTTVNLDDYEYVILNLKDYSKKSAFETNLQVKGSIAITPVYEFGTVEKETITDLCNTVYDDFTDYRFFILKNDLINNAVYIVKSCKNTNASFKYDSSLFDITYVTSENVNDPVVTFGGVDYHTIPFNKLSNTVNKNEEEGFIPGESEKFDPFDSVVDYISSFCSSLTTFMGLVTKFFNTLPIEIRAISITMFTTAITLGVIKFIKS